MKKYLFILIAVVVVAGALVFKKTISALQGAGTASPAVTPDSPASTK